MPGICQIAGYRSSMSTAKPILNFNGIKEILDSVHKNYIQFRTKACIDSFHEKVEYPFFLLEYILTMLAHGPSRSRAFGS